MNYFTNNIYIQGALFDVAQTSTVTEQTSTLGVGDTESVIGIYPWTMILTLVNFVVLFFILKKFLLKPVLAMIEKRSDIVKKDINDAQFAKEESLKQKNLYDDKMVNLKNEAIEIISTAQKKADRNADEIIADANKKAAAA
ncbi:MAG: ATP synthase F0 subunit B, partial [Clostridia bacterium]